MKLSHIVPLLGAIGACLAFSVHLQAATLANFDDGNGAVSPDQFVGTAGDGWAGAWSGTGTSSTVTATNPLNGAGDPYLSSGGTGSGNRTLRRQFSSPNPSNPYSIRWQWRFDGNFSQFGQANDRIHFFGDNSLEGGSGSGNSWLIGVTANRSGFGDVNGEFYFFDGSGGSGFSVANMFDTDLVLQDDTIYNFEVIVDPASATYSASVTDGINSASADGLGFRNGTPGVYDILHFGMSASTGGDDLTFALDSISIAETPEPASIALWSLIGVVGLGFGWRRCRASKC